MSFSIVSSDPGVARLHIEGGVDEATTYILRVELATLLRQKPSRVDLSLRRPGLFDDAMRGLLLSFFEVLRAQGGSLVLRGPDESPLTIGGAREMERLLKTSPSGSG